MTDLIGRRVGVRPAAHGTTFRRGLRCLSTGRPAASARRVMQSPEIVVGTPEEYRRWERKARAQLGEMGRSADDLERVDATIHYDGNRVTLLNLQDPRPELSVTDT